jgi:hypothetical protein
MTRIQREQKVIRAFNAGQRLTVSEVAILAQVSYSGAWKIINRLEGVIPLCEDESTWPRRYHALGGD